MEAIITEILNIASQILAAAPQVLNIVQDAINAFEAKDQAALDAAHAAAVNLADSLAPANP